MKRQTWIRLLMVLTVLAVTLGIGAPPAQEAAAAPCCEECDQGESACLTYPESTHCNGDSICCAELWRSCYNWCFSCF